MTENMSAALREVDVAHMDRDELCRFKRTLKDLLAQAEEVEAAHVRRCRRTAPETGRVTMVSQFPDSVMLGHGATRKSLRQYKRFLVATGCDDAQAEKFIAEEREEFGENGEGLVGLERMI